MSTMAQPRHHRTLGLAPVDGAARPRRRAWRVLRGAGAGLGALVVFVVALVAGVLLHLNTPAGKRVVLGQVNGLLGSLFLGKITIHRVGHLGLSGVHDADGTIDDPAGRRVLSVRGMSVDLATLALARSLLLDKRGPLIIGLSGAIDALDVCLDTDADGSLELVQSFASRKPSSPPDPSARGARIAISQLTLGHAWAHGQMAGAPPIDADVDGLRGALTVAPDVLEADVARGRLTAHRLVNGADVTGSLQAHVRKPSDDRIHPDAQLAWDGKVGGIGQSIRGSFVRDTVDAVVDVPEASPGDIRALWPGSPIERPARLHLEARGPLGDVGVALQAALGDASFDADARLALEGEKTAHLTFRARDLDVHELAASAPASRLALTGEVFADRKTDGALTGNAALRFLGGVIGTTALPAAALQARGSRSAAGALQGNATLVVDEPGAPTQLTLALGPKRGSSVVDFKLDSKVADFQRVPQLGHGVDGQAQLSSSGQIDLTHGRLDAALHAEGAALAQGVTRLQTLSVDASAHGPLASPHVEATVCARGIVAAGLRFVSADVTATGAVMAPHVTASVRGPDTPDLDARMDLGFHDGVSLQNLGADLARGADRSRITARRVEVGGGDLRVDEGRIEGLGAPLTVTLAMTPQTLRVRAQTAGIDLARVARLAQVAKSLQSGTLALDTDLRLRRGAAEGRLVLDAAHVSVAAAKELAAHAELSLQGRTLVGRLHAESPGVGVLDLNIPKVTIGGAGALTEVAWREAFGSVDLDVRTDLARLAALVPPESLPLSEAGGRVTLKAHLARDGVDDVTPDVNIDVDTDHLVLAPWVPMVRDIDGVLVHPRAAWRLAGVDLTVNAAVDGDTGALRASAEVHDVKGELVTLEADAGHFPFADVLHDPGRLTADLRTTRLGASLTVPERALGSLPPLLKQSYVTGKLHGNLTVQGTLLAPTVTLSAGLRHAAFASNALTAPLDVDVAAQYDGRHATGSVKAQSRDQALLDVETQIDLDAAQLLEASGTPPPWTASARAHMASFPLQTISLLDDKLVSGKLSGDVSLADLHKDAHLDASLSVDALSVGSIGYRSASVQLKADGRTIDGAVRIDQADGFAEAKAHAVAAWGSALAPTLDPAQPLQASLTSKNWRIAALLPFVDRIFDELDGRLDASARVELDPRVKAAKLSGTLGLRRGTLEASAGGGELHDITASVRFTPDGTITLERLSAAGSNGRLEAVGAAQVQGTSLRSAHATVTIPGTAAIPLTVGGTDLGNVDGRVDITAGVSPSGRGMLVKVDVPRLDVKLSESASGTPESLGPMANVRIGAHRGDSARFVLLPIDPAPKTDTSDPSKPAAGLSIKTHLGEVHLVRGTDLAVDLDGNVNVNAGAVTQVSGQIHLKRGGALSVQGRIFVIDSGTVTFVDSPDNPEVVVKAFWTAPDGTIVIAAFTGPLKTGKVTLSSQPQLPKEEIVQLLLFGSADGKQAQTPANSTQNSALATAGGEAAQPLNHMLNQLGLGAVTAKVDTSDSTNPKPEVEVQIAKDISFQIAVVLGQPPPGVNPDHTLVTLDWRFLSKWSLATTVGDAGTTIFDLLWQRRY